MEEPTSTVFELIMAEYMLQIQSFLHNCFTKEKIGKKKNQTDILCCVQKQKKI